MRFGFADMLVLRVASRNGPGFGFGKGAAA
jgi:hypothetical protein